MNRAAWSCPARWAAAQPPAVPRAAAKPATAAAAAANLRRLSAAGLEGDYGFFDSIDYTNRDADRAEDAPLAAGHATGAVVRTYLAHHEGMTLVALANALLDDPMVKRFHADPR